jgi:hypothetical protein
MESNRVNTGRAPARPIILGWFIPRMGVLVVALSCTADADRKAAPCTPTDVALKIERKDGRTGSFREIATLPGQASAFTDSGIVPGKIYFYRAGAVAADGAVAYSEEVAALAHRE